nr:MAG TPA: hypothetical protein [Caudoviricetes sp.]
MIVIQFTFNFFLYFVHLFILLFWSVSQTLI